MILALLNTKSNFLRKQLRVGLGEGLRLELRLELRFGLRLGLWLGLREGLRERLRGVYLDCKNTPLFSNQSYLLYINMLYCTSSMEALDWANLIKWIGPELDVEVHSFSTNLFALFQIKGYI